MFELFATMYVVSYLAFIVPAMSAGLLIAPFGLLATALGYLAFLAFVAGPGAALQWTALGRTRAITG